MTIPLPARFRAPVRKYGPRLNSLAQGRYKISGEALLAKLGALESGWDPHAKSYAGALEEFQFMPGTRASFKSQFGVDAYGSPDDKVHAAVLHLLGKGGHGKGLEGYNPGGGDHYVRQVLGTSVGNVRKQLGLTRGKGKPPRGVTGTVPRGSANPAGTGGVGGLPTPDPGGDGVAALLSALQAEPRPSIPQTAPSAGTTGRSYLKLPATPEASAPPPAATPSLSELLALNTASGPDGLPQPEGTKDFYGTNAPDPRPRTGKTRGASGGSVNFAPGADRAGVGTNAKVKRFVRQISATYGAPLTVGTGTHHSQFVAGTNRQSDHWDGNAVDIPARGKKLIRLGQAALIAAGMNPKKARKQTGGLYNLNGHQIIFNTHEGGDHTDHLHASAP
jgi:hypothetical protein